MGLSQIFLTCLHNYNLLFSGTTAKCLLVFKKNTN